MTDDKKYREFWVKATGHQHETSTTDKLDEIDLSNPGEDRWIYTHIQTVDPGTNSVAKSWKWLHVIEMSAYRELEQKLEAMTCESDVHNQMYEARTKELHIEHAKNAALEQKLSEAIFLMKSFELLAVDNANLEQRIGKLRAAIEKFSTTPNVPFVPEFTPALDVLRQFATEALAADDKAAGEKE